MPYLVYAGVLTLLHNSWLFLLEALQFGSVWDFVVKTSFSTLLSVMLIIVTELLFSRKQQFRTNTV
jgi:hypothetical protein